MVARWAVIVGGCAALGACSQPAWRDPARAHGAAVLPPEVVAVSQAEASVRRGTAKADLVTNDPMPAPPAWAADMLGHSLREIYPKMADCIGNTDAVKVRYGDGLGGSRIAGWGWDPAAKAPVPHVVLVDRDLHFVGFGDAGARRRDVPKAVPYVTTDFAGWEALTPLNAGPLDAYGVLADGKTICKLGHIEL